jgi:hypothetical protein
MDSETFKAAQRRHIQPTNVGPGVAATYFETSYQSAYFPQAGKPVNHVTSGSTYQKAQPNIKPFSSSVSEVLAQSKTTMSDNVPLSLTAYRNPKQIQTEPNTRFQKIQQPKALPQQYPVPLEKVSRKCA